MERAEVRDHAAELFAFLADGFLEVGELGGGLLGGLRELAAKDIELDIEAEKSLEDAVVQIAGDAAAFGFDGAGAEIAQKEDVFEWRAEMADDLFEPTKIAAGKGARRIDEDDAAGGATSSFDGDGEERASGEFVMSGAGRGGHGAEGLAGAAIPAPAVAGGGSAFGGDGGACLGRVRGGSDGDFCGDGDAAFGGVEDGSGV